MSDADDWSGVWVFGEVRDHEEASTCALELLTKGRELADQLGQRLACVTFGLDVEQYLPDFEAHGPDVVYYWSHADFKHYNPELFVPPFLKLVKEKQPNVVLFPATEAGSDLAARLAVELETGLTSHVTNLELVNDEEVGPNLLVMDKPAFGGNTMASIVCPHHRPVLVTVKPGVFSKKESESNRKVERVAMPYESESDGLVVRQVAAPQRSDPPTAQLEDAPVIVGGGQGVGSEERWAMLEKLAQLLGGKVGASRNAVFKGWAREEQLIGQTGVTVAPDVYLCLGISGQVQHNVGVLKSGIIIAVNKDPKALIFEVADYCVVAKLEEFLPKLLEAVKDQTRLK
ncbi:MAG: electron transfer flavoprotein subunit alpha/FixB family protein [Promethearchaeota archaeon]